MGERSPGAGRKVMAAGVLAAMVAALVYTAGHRPPPPGQAAVVPEAPDLVVVPETAVVHKPEAQPEPDPAAAPPSVVATAPEAPPATEAPTFDVVRVSPDGSALVAGHAAPGAVVTVMADDQPLAEVEADAEGNFVAIFRAEPSGAPQALTLEAEEPDGASASSEDVVMLLPEAPAADPTEEPAAAQDAQAVTGEELAAQTSQPGDSAPDMAQAGAPAAPEPAIAAAEPESTLEPEAAIVAAAEPEGTAEPEGATVAATAILRPDAVEAAPTGSASRDVTLASVAYAEQGEVTLAGLGSAGSVLRLYVDDAFAREAAVGTDGRWSMALGDVAEGVYRLRIDQLGADGKVASRVETPFQRDYPDAPPSRPDGGPGGTIVVQPGNNLWTLARAHYGAGVHYTQIFTANRAQIRDPDLIYPGQIFAMPERPAE